VQAVRGGARVPSRLVSWCTALPQDMRREEPARIMHVERATQVRRIETRGKKLQPIGYATMKGPEWLASIQAMGRPFSTDGRQCCGSQAAHNRLL
jgi:hypothetical protein